MYLFIKTTTRIPQMIAQIHDANSPNFVAIIVPLHKMNIVIPNTIPQSCNSSLKSSTNRVQAKAIQHPLNSNIQKTSVVR